MNTTSRIRSALCRRLGREVALACQIEHMGKLDPHATSGAGWYYRRFDDAPGWRYLGANAAEAVATARAAGLNEG